MKSSDTESLDQSGFRIIPTVDEIDSSTVGISLSILDRARAKGRSIHIPFEGFVDEPPEKSCHVKACLLRKLGEGTPGTDARDRVDLQKVELAAGPDEIRPVEAHQGERLPDMAHLLTDAVAGLP